MEDYLWQNGVYCLLTICTVMPTLDTSSNCKVLSHGTSPQVLNNRMQENNLAKDAVDAWLAIGKARALLKAVQICPAH